MLKRNKLLVKTNRHFEFLKPVVSKSLDIENLYHSTVRPSVTKTIQI